jgi:MFS family permease
MSRDLRFVAAALVFWGVGEGLFIYVIPIYLQEFGATPVQIGTILGAAAVVMTVSHIPAGALSDHFSRRSLMIAGWFIGLLTAVAMFLATSLGLYVAALVGYFFTFFVISPLNSYVTAARGAWSVTRALTTIGASFTLGEAIGAFWGGVIAERYGMRSAYGLAGFFLLASCLLILFARKQPVERPEGDHRYRSLLGNHAFARFVALVFLATFAMYLSWPLTPNYLQNVRGVTVRQIGLYGSFNALGLVALNLGLGRLMPRTGFLASHALVAGSVLLLWKGEAAAWHALGYLLAGGLRTARAISYAHASSLVHRSQMGLAFGVMETFGGLVFAVAAPIAGLLYRASPALPYPVSLALIVSSALLAAGFTPRARRAEPVTSPPVEFHA